MKKQNLFVTVVATVLFIAINGVQNVSAQTPVSDAYYNGAGRTVYRVDYDTFFTQVGCEAGSTACIDGKQQAPAGELGLTGMRYANELTRGLIEYKVLGANEMIAYDGEDLTNIWLPNCHINVNGVWKKRPNRMKGPPISKPASSPKAAAPTTGCVQVLKEAFNAQNYSLQVVPQFGFTLNGTTQYNDATGVTTFYNVPVGAQTISEQPANNWEPLTPTTVTVNVSPGSQCAGVIFKNRQVLPPPIQTPAPAPVAQQEEEEEEGGPCKEASWKWSIVAGIAGAGTGVATGRGKGSRIAGGLVGGGGALFGTKKFGVCGAAVGIAGGGATGYFTRSKKGKNPLHGLRGGRENGSQTWQGQFVPATTVTPNPTGPPLVISFTPIGSNNTIHPTGSGGGSSSGGGNSNGNGPRP